MPILVVHNLEKSFADNHLLRSMSFHIEEGERVGLVGINGSGKTTLMRILAGLDSCDSGQVQLRKQAVSGLLRQYPDPAQDVQAIIESGYDPELAACMNQIGLEADPLLHSETLSGGERTRLSLARFLAARFDLMLLDEPTNNMDLNGIQATIWQLRQHQGSMMIVSHDRYFLDQMVTRILELENGEIHEFHGNYSDYREQKKLQYEAHLHQYEAGRKEQKRIEQAIRQTRQWADKAHRKSTEKDKSGLRMGVKENKRVKAKKMDQKVKSDTKRLEKKVQQLGRKPAAEASVRFEINQAGRQGKRILEASDLSKKYAENTLFTDSYFYLQRGEKAAVFGPNGCGKTTLVRLMQKAEQPDGGELWISSGTNPYYLNQQVDDLPDEVLLKDYLIDRLGRLDGQNRAVLDQMGFSQRQLGQTLKSFSLGERMKIKLLEPILTHRDFLILDEPTNYLDLHTRETLEHALEEYDGTLMVISHDIYLLQKICDKAIVFEQGHIKRYEDSFADYLQKTKFNQNTEDTVNSVQGIDSI